VIATNGTAAPDIGEDHAKSAPRWCREELNVLGDQAEVLQRPEMIENWNRRSTRTPARQHGRHDEGIKTIARSIALNGMFSFKSSAR